MAAEVVWLVVDEDERGDRRLAILRNRDERPSRRAGHRRSIFRFEVEQEEGAIRPPSRRSDDLRASCDLADVLRWLGRLR